MTGFVGFDWNDPATCDDRLPPIKLSLSKLPPSRFRFLVDAH